MFCSEDHGAPETTLHLLPAQPECKSNAEHQAPATAYGAVRQQQSGDWVGWSTWPSGALHASEAGLRLSSPCPGEPRYEPVTCPRPGLSVVQWPAEAPPPIPHLNLQLPDPHGGNGYGADLNGSGT